jgi:hypothetical protein
MHKMIFWLFFYFFSCLTLCSSKKSTGFGLGLNSTRLEVTTILNPFTPLSLYDPPCSFNLLRGVHHNQARSPSSHCQKGESLDHFGLCTPCGWDCNLGNNKAVDYFYDEHMPSRTAECQCYCTDSMTEEYRISHGYGTENMNRKSHSACATTYIVDDEFEQAINVLQSVNIKTPHYTVVEIGSRQGQWALKAAMLAKQHYMGFKSIYACSIELLDEWKYKQKEKIRINNLENEVYLRPELITKQNYPALVKNLTMRTGTWQPINFMDWDCQGCEALLASKEAFKLYEENILSLFIAAHHTISKGIHDNLLKYYGNDVIFQISGTYACDKKNTNALNHNTAFIQTHEEKCLSKSLFGPVYYRDGSIRIFNKKLFDKLDLTLHMETCPPWEQT